MNKTIYLISGKKRSGKDTCAKFLMDKMSSSKKLSFASKLKEFAKEDFVILYTRINELLDSLSSEILENEEVDNIVKQLYTTEKDFGDGDKTLVSRSILELYGTDVMRKRVDNDYWIKQTIDGINYEFDENGIENIIISDFRFENEYIKLKNMLSQDVKFVLIRMERPSLIDSSNHISNIALDDYKDFDFTITAENIEEIKEAVNYII